MARRVRAAGQRRGATGDEAGNGGRGAMQRGGCEGSKWVAKHGGGPRGKACRLKCVV